MSISLEIRVQVAAGRLHPVVPWMRRDPGVEPRQMFVSNDIQELLNGPWHSEEWESRCGALRADLDRFVLGGMIPVAAHPLTKGKTAYIRQLSKRYDEVWEIRSRDPRPALRVFGRFAQVDTFIALTAWYREDLGGRESRAWRDAIVECKTRWTNLFPAYQPVSAEEGNKYPNAYISRNTYLV